MPEITRPTASLSLLVTPPHDAARDAHTVAQRLEHFDERVAQLRELSLLWPLKRTDEQQFSYFEAQLFEAVRQIGKASTELMLSCAQQHSRRAHRDRWQLGETTYRLCNAEPRSLTTWFGTIRYGRSYARPVDGGPGYFPLDVELQLLSDRISPSLLAMGARLSSRMSFAEAREVLGWFVPQPPSVDVLEQTVLGLGHHASAWFATAPVAAGDGEVLVVLIDGKCVPTATDAELQQRRGPRGEQPPAPSPRHRGRARRQQRGPRVRRKKGDKSKNGKQVTMVVMYTLRRDGELLLGPLNRTVYASFGPKRHAFDYAQREAQRRGFAVGSKRVVQVLTDGDRDLHRYTDAYFSAADFPHRVVTVDVMHVLEKVWDAGRARHKEGSVELAAWVGTQEDRLYNDDVASVISELQEWLSKTPKTGPGNKGRRKRLTDAIRYLEYRVDKLLYGTYRARDLEVGTGQVEGAVKHVIGKRCDHGGMRWIKERAQAVIQLRCIDTNGQWDTFVAWALQRLQMTAHAEGTRARLQTNTPAPLPQVSRAA